MNGIPQALQQHWTAIRPLLSIRQEDEDERATGCLNRLLDDVGTDEQHPLYILLETLGTLRHAYEGHHHLVPEHSGVDVLKSLMEAHGLTQTDLSEVGSQGVISDMLWGKRALKVPQLRALTKRFQVSPAVFI